MTARGNSLCFILLAVNGSWDDNGSTKALIIFLQLRERYCFFSPFIGWAWAGLCVCESTGMQGWFLGVHVRPAGVMSGWWTCITDPPLGVSCTQGGIKMIHGSFPGLILAILRYQSAVCCSWRRGPNTYTSRAHTHTQTRDRTREFFHRGWGDNLIGTFVFVSRSLLAFSPPQTLKQKPSSRGPAAAASVAYK